MDNRQTKLEESNNNNTASSPKVIWNSGQQTFKPTNRVIMLIGLDPNSTPGLIKKSFEAHGFKVSVDYRRDDTTGYVHLNLQMAKEVAAHIMTKGGLKVGTETVILRALDGIDEAMYWGVYAGTRSIGSKTTNQYKTITSKPRHVRRHHRHTPYLTNFKNIEMDDDIEDQQQQLSMKFHLNKCHSNNQHQNHKIHHYITKQKSKIKKKSKRNSKNQEAITHNMILGNNNNNSNNNDDNNNNNSNRNNKNNNRYNDNIMEHEIHSTNTNDYNKLSKNLFFISPTFKDETDEVEWKFKNMRVVSPDE